MSLNTTTLLNLLLTSSLSTPPRQMQKRHPGDTLSSFLIQRAFSKLTRL